MTVLERGTWEGTAGRLTPSPPRLRGRSGPESCRRDSGIAGCEGSQGLWHHMVASWGEAFGNIRSQEIPWEVDKNLAKHQDKHKDKKQKYPGLLLDFTSDGLITPSHPCLGPIGWP